MEYSMQKNPQNPVSTHNGSDWEWTPAVKHMMIFLKGSKKLNTECLRMLHKFKLICLETELYISSK